MSYYSTNIFKTPIWGYTITSQKNKINEYLKYILKICSDEPTVTKSNSGGGWQSRDTLHKDLIFEEFCDNILNKYIADSILKEYNSPSYCVQSMWASINYKHSFNYHHIHEGYLSGVFYLQVPENSGRLVFTNPAIRSEGHLIKENNYAIQPTPMACIVFPSWLEHYVEPNNSDEARVSISFNIGP